MALIGRPVLVVPFYDALCSLQGEMKKDQFISDILFMSVCPSFSFSDILSPLSAGARQLQKRGPFIAATLFLVCVKNRKRDLSDLRDETSLLLNAYYVIGIETSTT